MKKALFVIICLLLLFPLSIGHSAEVGKIDGYKWTEMNNSEKWGFLWGWICAGSEVIQWMPIIAFGTRDFKNLDTYEKSIRGFSEEWGLDLTGLTVGQVRDSIEIIYSDPRVKTWRIERIMAFVRGRLKGGWSEKDLDEVIAYYIKFEEERKKYESMGYKGEFPTGELKLSLPKVLKASRAYRFE